MPDLNLLRLDGPVDETLVDPVIVAALDGWTDAGRSGSLAAETLLEQWDAHPIGRFDPDALYDYRDRRPVLQIDRGVLGEPIWPGLEVTHLTPPSGTPPILLLHGAEPDFRWHAIAGDLGALARFTGAARYVGLGSVPGPVPHTRQTAIVTTGSDEEVLERIGRPHERITVPASCQVVLEAELRDHGLATLGLWARIPHYVAGDYPEGALALLRTLSGEIGADIDLDDLNAAADEHRERLDEAAASSEEILGHVRQLEVAYDEELAGRPMGGDIPTADEIGAEFERFLRRQTGDDPEGPPAF